jgi:hypothetical protein
MTTNTDQVQKLCDHILRISMEKQEQHSLLIENILKRIASFKPQS